MIRNVDHPGPVCAERMDLVRCEGRNIEVTLKPGIALEDAVALALSDMAIDSAWLEIADARVSHLTYVIPAHAPDREQVAWYSDVQSFEAGRIDSMGMIVGTYYEASFLHGHGTWTPDKAQQAMGHILAPQTILAEPVLARGFGLCGACFDRRLDSETCFELFHVDEKNNDHDDRNHMEVDQAAATTGEFAALRLRPNQDFSIALDQACVKLNWRSARVHGLGSLNGATFDDGRELASLPTEFLVTDAVAGTGGVKPQIIIVGVKGAEAILTGRLSRGENAVLVTAELVLERLS